MRFVAVLCSLDAACLIFVGRFSISVLPRVPTDADRGTLAWRWCCEVRIGPGESAASETAEGAAFGAESGEVISGGGRSFCVLRLTTLASSGGALGANFSFLPLETIRCQWLSLMRIMGRTGGSSRRPWRP